MILMVTGGRHFGMMRPGKNKHLVWAERNRAMDALNAMDEMDGGITTLIHGECPEGGADLVSDIWARARGIRVDPTPVDHEIDGPWPGAGPNRNGRMIAKRPDYLIAFDGNAGTANAVKQATAADIPVVDLRS